MLQDGVVRENANFLKLRWSLFSPFNTNLPSRSNFALRGTQPNLIVIRFSHGDKDSLLTGTGKTGNSRDSKRLPGYGYRERE